MEELGTAATEDPTTASVVLRRESKFETDFRTCRIRVCVLKIARCTIHVGPMVTVGRMRTANGHVRASSGGMERCAMNVSGWTRRTPLVSQCMYTKDFTPSPSPSIE